MTRARLVPPQRRPGKRSVYVCLLAILVTLIAACTAVGEPESTPTSASGRVDDQGVDLSLGQFGVSGSAAVGTDATVTVTTAAPPQQPMVDKAATTWLAPFSPTIEVTVDAGRQPGAPLRIAYTLPADSTPPPDAVPVAVSRGTDGSVDLTEGRIEGDTVMADVPHTGWRAFAWFRPGALSSKLVEAVNPVLGLGSPKPACAGEPLAFPHLVKTVSAVAGNIAWSCIMTTPGTNPIEPSTSVQLTVNSPFAWQVASTPQELRVVTVETDPAKKYLHDLYRRIAGATPVAGPGDTVRLDFGQYERSPRTGTLMRNATWDTTVLTILAYEQAFTGAFPGPATVRNRLDVADRLIDCSRSFDAYERIASDIVTCSQDFAASGVRLFFAKTATALVSYLTEKAGPGVATSATWTVTSQTRNSPAPPSGAEVVLGRATDRYSIGYGTPRPRTVSLNSLCANSISNITWESWGGPTATGNGMVCAPAASPSSGGPSVITATDLGDCQGTRAYRQLFVDGEFAWNICPD